MNIEDLSKAQLLLLTVMVNFVVSIATGVLTVSLLDQAPVQVSQGVDRIVEHTIQTIATPIQVVNPIKSIATGSATPAPTPEQQMTAAVGADLARTVLIYKGATTTPSLAFGTYLPKSRAVVTATTDALPDEAIIQFSDGSTLPASASHSSTNITVYGFADEAKLPQAPDAALVDTGKLKQGQTLVALTKDSAAVTGIISKVGASGSIETNLAGVPAGAGVVDLAGRVVGIGAGGSTLISGDAINALLQAPATVKK